MLDAVYVDAKETKSIVAIKPKSPFIPIFQVSASREKSDIRILNKPLKGSSVSLVENGKTLSLRVIILSFIYSSCCYPRMTSEIFGFCRNDYV